jgi:hypothetical protein
MYIFFELEINDELKDRFKEIETSQQKEFLLFSDVSSLLVRSKDS